MLSLDLGQAQPVESVDIDWLNSANFSTFYNLHVSTDGLNWESVQNAQTELKNGFQNISIGGRKIRYIRIFSQDNSDLANFDKISISEIKVNGYRDPILPENSFQISTPTFTDLSGNTVTGLAPGSTVIASISIKNIAFDPLKATFIVALYNSQDQLINISFSQKTLGVHEEENLGAGFNLPADVNGCYIKVFVWDSIDNMHPLSNAVKFPS
jgi:hypothetical protein